MTEVDPHAQADAAGSKAPETTPHHLIEHKTAPLDPAVGEVTAARPGSHAMAVVPGAVLAVGPSVRHRHEFMYFALRSKKLLVGGSVLLLFVLFAVFGPFFVHFSPFAMSATAASKPPSTQHWLGTTYFGEDVFAQLVYGTRSSFQVGLLGGGFAVILGMVIGFVAGYRGGLVDEALNLVTNVVICIPAIAVMLMVGSYLQGMSLLVEAGLIGLFAWPWAARAIRAQTFTLKSRDFVGLARLSGEGSGKIIAREIAPNMSSYLMLTFILLFGGAILTASFIDFVGLGPSATVTLGTMMNSSFFYNALQLHVWWWFIPPGAVIACIVGGLYLTNAGLDEVFNPKLRAL
jgi:peptide/nickel transport system permease protein